MTQLQAIRKVDLSANVLECIRHVIEKHDAALLEVMMEEVKKARREALEEAIATCERVGKHRTPNVRWTTDKCAAAIRALKEK